MIDPWRNHPSRKWDWYFHDFPITEVDIGASTHAHFDHDALHRLDAHVLLDRLIGQYKFGDMTITGYADKHAIDTSCAIYDFKKIHQLFHGVEVDPPDNPRSWDHCLIVVGDRWHQDRPLGRQPPRSAGRYMEVLRPHRHCPSAH